MRRPHAPANSATSQAHTTSRISQISATPAGSETLTTPAGPETPAKSATSARSSRRSGLIVLLALLAAVATLTVVGARGTPAPGQAEQVREIASGLRCPVCKDLSAADSPAPLARQMRQQVAQQLAAGRSAGQIRQGFIAAYGDSVLMTPPHTGLGQTAYLLPLLVMSVALTTAVVLLRRWRRGSEVGPSPSSADRAEDGAPTDGSQAHTSQTGRAKADRAQTAGAPVHDVLSASDQNLVNLALIRLGEEERR